jgi:hypothetical protein
MTGYAAKGPTDEILQVTSVSELEQIYGIPTTPAERYLHFSAKQILQSSSGNVFVNRLPYGEGAGEGYGSSYGALVYPILPVSASDVIVYRPTATVAATNYSILNSSSVIDTLTSGGVWSTSEVASLTASGTNLTVKYSTTKYSLLSGTIAGLMGPSTSTKISAITSSFTTANDTGVCSTYDASSAVYLIGEPKFFELTQAEYLSILDGTATAGWSNSVTDTSSINSVADFGKAGIIVLNVAQTTINTKAEGYYFGITDNTNAIPTTDHDSLVSVNTISQSAASTGVVGSGYTQIPDSRLYFALTATNDAGFNRNAGSISNDIESGFYKYADSTTDKFDDVIAASVYRLRQSPYTSNAIALEYINAESYLGSFDYYRQIQDQNGGPAVSYYLGGITEPSANVRVLINENINSRKTTTWLDTNGLPSKKVRLVSHSALNALTDFEQSGRYGVYYSDMIQAANTIG